MNLSWSPSVWRHRTLFNMREQQALLEIDVSLSLFHRLCPLQRPGVFKGGVGKEEGMEKASPLMISFSSSHLSLLARSRIFAPQGGGEERKEEGKASNQSRGWWVVVIVFLSIPVFLHHDRKAEVNASLPLSTGETDRRRVVVQHIIAAICSEVEWSIWSDLAAAVFALLFVFPFDTTPTRLLNYLSIILFASPLSFTLSGRQLPHKRG